jgi:multidrug transporter EmrE-like cation transporter
MALITMRQLLDHVADFVKQTAGDALAIATGTGYAVWTGIGAVGAAILGIILFGESRDPARLACVAMIVVGIIGLKITSSD